MASEERRGPQHNYRQGSEELMKHFKKLREDRQIPTKKKLQRKQTCSALPNSTIIFKVISTGAYNSGKSVLLQAEFSSYMFNSGDGIMRQCFDNNGKWSKLEHLFITHKSYKNLAGTLEMTASVAEAGNNITDLCMHGCGYVDCLVKTDCRTFSKDLLQSLKRHSIDELFEDNVMRVEYIQLRDVTQPDDDDSAACAFKLIFRAPKRKVETSKLAQFGVKPGPWIRQLIDSNEAVEVNGKTITPEMVLGAALKSKVALVIDCPTANHLPSLSAHTDTLSKTNGGDFIDLVMHMTPDHITEHEVYQKFMTSFPVSTQQIVVSERVDATSLRYAWDQQVHFNMIEEDMFPLLHPRPSHSRLITSQAEGNGNVVVARPGLAYNLKLQKMETPESFLADLTRESALRYFNADSEHLARVMSVVEKRKSHTCLQETREYPTVTMLGTGASKSVSTRNTTGILVETCKDKYMLLDCGYGILGQITHLYGPERTNHILRNINMVFVSHGHPDHHAGLLALLCCRKDLFAEHQPSKMSLVFPTKLHRWFTHLDAQFGGCLANVELVQCDQLYYRGDNLTTPGGLLAKALDLQAVSTFDVEHAYSKACYGISLHCNGYKLVYSGDTMPCEQLVRAAMDADLLIHEATFGDAFWRDAKLKTHSTTSQALEVAKRCQAKFTLLTHFSSRHHRVPPYSQQLMESSNVGVAFDNMVLRPKDLPNTTLASLWQVLSAMYPQYVDNTTSCGESNEGDSLKETFDGGNRKRHHADSNSCTSTELLGEPSEPCKKINVCCDNT